MSVITLNVNGRRFEADVPPRTQLAELLRDKALLTGTHLGCEHGICGACTVLIDGAPARSCITYAVACEGAEITTIEGLDDDPLAVELRAAFRQHHALQCGFCTPGMLITARDIVARLPGAGTDRIRLELAGNLCRCTGYAGALNAVRQVADARGTAVQVEDVTRLGPVGARPVQDAAQTAAPATAVRHDEASEARLFAPTSMPRPQHALQRRLSIAAPIGEVWAQFADVAALARCLPGAEFAAPDASGVLHGRLRIKFGPIGAAFEAGVNHTVDAARHRGGLVGQGYDRRTGTRVTAEIDYALNEDDAGAATAVDIDVRYGLSGTLAQFARGALAERFADRLTADFALNLERLLNGMPLEHMQSEVPATDAASGLHRLWLTLLQVLRVRQK